MSNKCRRVVQARNVVVLLLHVPNMDHGPRVFVFLGEWGVLWRAACLLLHKKPPLLGCS